MRASVAKIRDMFEIMHRILPLLTDDEISDIGKVILKALARIESGQKAGEKQNES